MSEARERPGSLRESLEVNMSCNLWPGRGVGLKVIYNIKVYG